VRAGRLVAAGALTVAVAAAPALAAFDAGEVTIRVRLFSDPGTRTRELQISGTVANRAAGETVDVQAKDCGPNYRFYRVVAGAKTIQGGTWQLEQTKDGVDLYQLPINAYFRARWQGNVSEPELVRVPAFATATWRPLRRVVDVSVSTGQSGQNLRGRVVELQRKVEGTDQWVLVRRARLGRGSYARFLGQSFKARFSIPTRGLTLRAFVPAATAAPCFSAGFSQSFES
jgi:hypothetical protein